jgi:uncharacterized protein YggE
MRRALGWMAVLALFGSPIEGQSPSPVDIPIIKARRSSRVILPADGAILTVSILTSDSSALGTGAKNRDLTTAVIEAIRRVGTARDELATTGYGVAMNVGRSIQDTSYVATNSVRVTIRDVALVGTVIDHALAAGANRVVGVQYIASEAPVAYDRALHDAVIATEASARVMAEASGGRLGSLVDLSIVEPGYWAATSPFQTAEATTPIEPGVVYVVVIVEGRWYYDSNR